MFLLVVGLASLVGVGLIASHFVVNGDRYRVARAYLVVHAAILCVSQASYFGQIASLANQSLALSTVVLAIVGRFAVGRVPIPRWALAGMALGATVGLFGLVASDAFTHMATWFTLASLIWAAVHYRCVPGVERDLGFLAAAYCSFYLISFFTGIGAFQDRLGQWFLWGANPNQLATISVAAAALGLRGRRQYLLLLGGFIAFVSGSVAAVLGSVGVLVVWWARRVGGLWATAAVAGLATWALTSSYTVEVDAGQRGEFLADFAQFIQQSPVLGALSRPGLPARLIDFRGQPSSAHNLYVEVAFIAGIIGFSLLALMAWHLRASEGKPVLAGAVILGLFTIAPLNPTYFFTLAAFILVDLGNGTERITTHSQSERESLSAPSRPRDREHNG